VPESQFKNSRVFCHRAKQLRQQAPMPERLLWNALSELKKATGLKFRRQHPVQPYILDFACVAVHLAIELDGPSHDKRQAYDARRTEDLQKLGWTVIRFTNEDVRENLEGVVLTLLAKVAELQVEGQTSGPSLSPSRKGGREADRSHGEKFL
jgi:very-short-patch-repair endonuclease